MLKQLIEGFHLNEDSEIGGVQFNRMRDASFRAKTRSSKTEGLDEGIDVLVKYWKKRLKDVKHPWAHLHRWALRHPKEISDDPKAWAAWMHGEVFGMTPMERRKALERKKALGPQ